MYFDENVHVSDTVNSNTINPMTNKQNFPIGTKYQGVKKMLVFSPFKHEILYY